MKFYAKIMMKIISLEKKLKVKYSQQEFVNTVETNYKALLNEKNKLEKREKRKRFINLKRRLSY